MATTARTGVYRRVRRWVDHDLAHHWRPISLFGPLVLAALAMMPLRFGTDAFFPVLGTVLTLFCAWNAFVLWRVARIIRAVSIKGDREFDRYGKYLLPSEYAASESYLAHQRRRHRLRRLTRR
ncbi:hypothetical protein [Brevundimonas viscosa]|uniref:Uncharacterized protein n=1 Tax=Brevundimonas viscosa TaxID=871741 RepID=A0A1I6SJL8_9CAUL|nr:hypothetical protein [Brevundimonas viscosa]SFS77142.1 hypothetical protein SAMN05192570_2496 [Brevundimonas viscosa]